MRWMNQEPVIQSEASQKEKNEYHKYHILMRTYEIWKNSTDEPIYREEMELQMQRTDL